MKLYENIVPLIGLDDTDSVVESFLSTEKIEYRKFEVVNGNSIFMIKRASVSKLKRALRKRNDARETQLSNSSRL